MAPPQIGKTYTPDASIVPVSLGLPRRVTDVKVVDDVYIVWFTTDLGKGILSGNRWEAWMQETGARDLTGVER